MNIRRSKLVLPGALCLAGVALGLAAAALLAGPSGCASDCASHCPPDTIYVGTTDEAKTVPSYSIQYSGPACPFSSGYCQGDVSAGTCHHFTVTGLAEGSCDVTIGFTDRPAEILHLTFGPAIQQGCCAGHEIVGPDTYFIPTDPTQVIYAADGGASVTVLVDGGAVNLGDAAGPNDAGAD